MRRANTVRVRPAVAVLAGGLLLAGGCASTEGTRATGAGRDAAGTGSLPGGRPASSPAVSGSPAPTATTAPTAPAAPTVRPTLRPGARGDGVRELQRRLRELRYDPGTVDGRYGPATQMAVWAFEKVNRIKVSGTLGKRFWKALDAPKSPVALTARRERDRVDIDLRRQYLVVYKAGRVALISHISSGSGAYYCAKDFGSDVPRCRYAVTSTGDFRTGRRVTGWDPSPLGQLYNPVYFNGGIAVHGYPSVPPFPASHGCVRIPMRTSHLFQHLVGTGVPVHVRRKG